MAHKALFLCTLVLLVLCSVYSTNGQNGCNQNGAWPTDAFSQLISNLTSLSFSADRLTYAENTIQSQNRGLTANQTVQILQTLSFTVQKVNFITNTSNYMLGLTCYSVITILNQISFSSERLTILPILTNLTIDLSLYNETIVNAFSMSSDREACRKIIANSVQFSCVWGDVTSKRRLLFIVDKSGSMETAFRASDGLTYTRLQYVSKELSMIISKVLRDYQFFNVMYFSSNAQTVFNGVQPVNNQSITSALRFVQSFQPVGGTNMLGALQSAILDKTLNAIFLLSDGQPDDGQNNAILSIAKNWGNPINTISFQAGGTYDPKASAFMLQIAQASKGVYRSTN